MYEPQSELWFSESLDIPKPVDTVIFDVDGVLWDTADSWDEAVKQTVDHVLRKRLGQASVRPVTEEELRAFRRAGGLNNDWDLTYTLVATRLSGREDYEAAAAESGGHGRSWAQTLLDGHQLDFEELVSIFNEIYWGADDYVRLFDRQPRYVADATGCWYRERPLFSETLLSDLRTVGVRHFGIATGRNTVELSTVLRESGLDQQIATRAMITADILAKPHGRVLALALDALADLAVEEGKPVPESALFCGDTRDDLDAVLNYRTLHGEESYWVGAVAVVPNSEISFFQQAGADAVVENVNQLPVLVQRIRRLYDDR